MNTKQTVITAKREMVVGHDAAAHLGRQRIKKLCTTGDRRTGLAQMQYVKAAIKQPTDKKSLSRDELGRGYHYEFHTLSVYYRTLYQYHLPQSLSEWLIRAAQKFGPHMVQYSPSVLLDVL